MAFTIPFSLVTQYRHNPNDPRRVGQKLYDFLNLEKLQDPEDRIWADRLYELDRCEARVHLEQRVDYEN